MTWMIAVFLCMSFNLLSANSDLIGLYEERMQAERSGDNERVLLIDSRLADHYLSVSDFKKARLFLENTIAYGKEPEISDRKLDIYRLDIIEGELDRAESGLIGLYFYSDDTTQRSRAAHLLGILNALKGDYERARKFLTESVQLQGEWTPEFGTTLDSLMRDAQKRKNIQTAKWLSGFLPGAGQIYAKNAKGAIGAIGIAAFWGGWFVYDLIQQDYYSAALVLIWPWQRYHRGNIQNAGHSVETYNLMIEDKINRALLDYLSK